ncbi:MAG TPA: ATP-binding protein [Paludibacteraceae bacterium]|nr:ATP-binding protein [Paludibacteraceae bacterium]HPO47770.1 ATP-binding protein [Paludibacteraceae bacterium]HPW95397.1 ATP-binding protein [Paludibacteraceae bacterium]
MLKTIVITGPESTGKTTLAKELAAHFGADWIPEYARTYIETLGRPYTYDDVEKIALKQKEQFDAALNAKGNYVFFDTYLFITHVWFLHVYQREPVWIKSALKECQADLFLLCRPNIPWEYDPIRENPNNRDFFYDWYKRELLHYGKKIIEIDRLGKQRTEQAIAAVNLLTDTY